MVELTASVGTAVQTIVDDVLSLHEVQLYDLEFSGGALRVVLEAADDVRRRVALGMADVQS